VSRRAKRRRRRPATATAPRPAPPPSRPRANPATSLAARTARDKPREERPRAPWHPVPLAELCVLLGIVLMVVGLIVGLGNDRGRLSLVTGMALGSLGGLDTAAREHFSGYTSHHTVLAGVPAVAAAAILYFARAPWIAVAAGTVLVFAAAILLLRRAWRRATD
jgi:hypothetical protein